MVVRVDHRRYLRVSRGSADISPLPSRRDLREHVRKTFRRYAPACQDKRTNVLARIPRTNERRALVSARSFARATRIRTSESRRDARSIVHSRVNPSPIFRERSSHARFDTPDTLAFRHYRRAFLVRARDAHFRTDEKRETRERRKAISSARGTERGARGLRYGKCICRSYWFASCTRSSRDRH